MNGRVPELRPLTEPVIVHCLYIYDPLSIIENVTM
jgi:hypothetical protein